MKKLVLLRHGQSQWNLENRFTGWTDVDLTAQGEDEARQAGRLMAQAGLNFDRAFTSYLTRAIKTLNLALETMHQLWIPADKTWRLNEKHYGALQGLNKSQTAQQYGDEQVLLWRRAYDVRPPALAPDDPRHPSQDPRYRGISPTVLPATESLQDCIARLDPYWQNTIVPALQQADQILIAAHGNSLRALVMQFEKLTPEEILEVNIPTGVPCSYTFDKDWNVVDKHYIGDPATIEAKINAVANQGKAK